MKNKNPLNPTEKAIPRVEPELESDNFSKSELKDISEMIMKDYEVGYQISSNWISDKEKDLKQYDAQKPSILEGLSKKPWMSDRNLGLVPSTCDAYQSTLLSTCWNPDTIHAIATEENDYQNKDNLVKFMKWAIDKSEGNVYPEVDDFIHNRITMGFSVFKIYWKVWYEWVDKRIPTPSGGYRIKTEKMRFEKGVMKNIDDIDDIIIPDYGKNLQDQPFLMETIHMNSIDFTDNFERNVFKNIDNVDKFLDKIKAGTTDENNRLRRIKEQQLGEDALVDYDPTTMPVDLLEYYGWWEKNGKKERYRFVFEPYTETVLSGKPVRKITRSGKIPYVGGPFVRKPGKVRGKSLIGVIADVSNAINNVFNQKSDFQFVSNCAFGFHRVTEEGYTKQAYDLEPGVSYPTGDDNPKDSVYFPNLSRSSAWAYEDIKLLFEVLERATGAAAYFMSNERGVSGTATRDKLINEKSETRFGLWVKRLQSDICEALTMFMNMYQDWSPPDLGSRVLGKEGDKIFKNLSIKTLRGNYDVRMSPDITSGSKAFEKEVMLWGYENLMMSPFMNPQVNPKGAYHLAEDTAKKVMGIDNVERYLGQEPPDMPGQSDNLDDEWNRFRQGDVFEPPEGPTQMAMQHLVGHMKQKGTLWHELDEVYRANFEQHLMQTAVNVQQFQREMQQEEMANKMAMDMIGKNNRGEARPEVME